MCNYKPRSMSKWIFNVDLQRSLITYWSSEASQTAGGLFTFYCAAVTCFHK